MDSFSFPTLIESVGRFSQNHSRSKAECLDLNPCSPDQSTHSLQHSAKMEVPEKTGKMYSVCFTIILRGRRDYTQIMNARVNSIEMYCSQVIEVLNLCFIIYEGNSLGFPGRLNHLSYVEVLWEYENNRCEALWVGTNLEAGALSWGHWIRLTQCVTVLLPEIHSELHLHDCAQRGMSLGGTEGSQMVGVHGQESVWNAKHCFTSTAWSVSYPREENLWGGEGKPYEPRGKQVYKRVESQTALHWE